jgi:7-cyano-7-deazaguanine synthase
LDSATTLALARDAGYDAIALSFRYGQRHVIELTAAAHVAAALGASEHRTLDIDLQCLGGSALTDPAIAVPKHRDLHGMDIPITYVPARNTIFLAFAVALAEVRGARDIFIGVNAVDYSGYPDCRPEFISAFEAVARLGTRAGSTGSPFRIQTPLAGLTKEQIIRRGLALGVDYSLTRSCYDPDPAGRACGACDSCRIRLAAFARLGRPDPAPYRDLPDGNSPPSHALS